MQNKYEIDEILKITGIIKQEFIKDVLTFKKLAGVGTRNLYATIEFSNGLKLKAYNVCKVSNEKIDIGDEVRVIYKIYKTKYSDGEAINIYDKDYKFSHEKLTDKLADEEIKIVNMLPFDDKTKTFKTNLESFRRPYRTFMNSKDLIWLYHKYYKENQELKQSIASIVIDEIVRKSSYYDDNIYDGIEILKVLNIANKIMNDNNIFDIDYVESYENIKYMFLKARDSQKIFHDKFTD